VTDLLDELLARCAAGDHAAAGELVRRFRTYAMNLAHHILGDHHLAEDAVQEAFIAALDRLPDLRTPDAFPGWLRQIVRTHAVRARRRRETPARSRSNPETHSPSPAQAVETEELRRLVRAAVVSLPERSRETAELYYLNELDHHRVAEALDVPPGTVKRRLHDARRHLRDELARYLEQDQVRPSRRRRADDRPGP
jgi:RNA polymerase sigma-70 factor (ECF subfamily)